MSNRYNVEVFDSNKKMVDYIQLFGNNDYIEELHEFASKCGFDVDADDCYFRGTLDGNQLSELYKVVDKVCIDVNNESPLTIDVADLYKRYSINFSRSLGECLIGIVDGQYRVLQSAMLLMFMWRLNAIECWSPNSISVKDGYEVVFSWQ